MPDTLTGGCLCGRVRDSATPEFRVAAWHGDDVQPGVDATRRPEG